VHGMEQGRLNSQSKFVCDPLEGIDQGDQPIHVRIQGTMLTYCGRRIDDSTYLPPAEVTEASWCPDCVRIQDGV
jgi:hypothetical protein